MKLTIVLTITPDFTSWSPLASSELTFASDNFACLSYMVRDCGKAVSDIAADLVDKVETEQAKEDATV
jgi:hypothetical protein